VCSIYGSGMKQVALSSRRREYHQDHPLAWYHLLEVNFVKVREKETLRKKKGLAQEERGTSVIQRLSGETLKLKVYAALSHQRPERRKSGGGKN